ncbi:carbohydrate kinase [Mucilaginibacter sp. BJC16-A38]|uniref:carbohydrate kinase family protein n=1 Tax=Mucilaginibacter phenanthrenivorans TaxID=1234842 RepID=UPI002157862E|nr:carbohydrate kinase [Mucilaginibacter phenanthrenivorans]MCR8558694.1 carbohydrate kinase [Mucilaginibacter phenanthrenivorans]
MKHILCFGEILWDAFGEEKTAGGAPMNVARHLVQQHMNVLFASRVGKDASGDGLVDFLKGNGLYSELIQTDEKLPTCEVTVSLDDAGVATYIIPEPVSWDNIQTEPALTKAASQAAAIVYGSLACREEATKDTLLNLLQETTALKVFDVNLRPPHYTLSTIETLVAGADVIKMNEDEAALLIGGNTDNLKENIIEFQKKYHPKTICVTRGEHGAMAWHDYEFYEHPGCPVSVVDTVGAGDAFLAAFVSGLLKKEPMQQLIERACLVGSFVAGKRGANPVYDESLVAKF